MQEVEKKFKKLNELLEGRVKRDVPIAPFTTFKIGGPATMFFEALTNEDLVKSITFARKFKIPFYLLSGGSNVLVNDKGVDKLVIKISTSDLIIKENYIVADGGVPLASLVNASIENGLQGLVWASGIPGNVSGAVRGNAGAYGGEMKDSIHSIEVMRGSKQFVIEREHLTFGYRDSQFKHNNDIILAVKFEFAEKGKVDVMRVESEKIIAERKEKHPEAPCAGSFFKNILITEDNEEIFKKLGIPEKSWGYKKVPSGWLLDQVDMRGKSIGGAKVSDKHANIIVNTGDATADDVLQLVSLMKTKVRDELGIQIEEEVQLVGF